VPAAGNFRRFSCRLAALMALALAAPLAGQVRLDHRDAAHRQAINALNRILTANEKPPSVLACRIDPIAPSLGFDLRLWAGYLAAIPAREFSGQGASAVTAMLRIDPIEPPGQSVYLGRKLNIPAIPATVPRRTYISAAGGFSLGAGRYRASVALADANGRVCLKQWNIKAKPGRGGVSLLAPGAVASSSGTWTGFRSPTGKAGARRATILIDAYPVYRRRHVANLSWRDRMTLLNVLNSVLSQSGFDGARVIAFDLGRRQVVFDEPVFQPASFDPLADALAKVNLATIDYSTLSHGPSERQFLASLVRGVAAAESPGQVIFLSPQRPSPLRAGPRDDSVWEGIPRPVLFSLLPRPVAEGPVADFARSGRARVFNIYLPSDLAPAVRRLTADPP